MSCRCQCCSNNSRGCGSYPNFIGGGLSCRCVTPLLLLILIALQFGRCDHDHDDPCHHESGCKIDNSVLFIIALFLLLVCGCGCSGASNYNNGYGC